MKRLGKLHAPQATVAYFVGNESESVMRIWHPEKKKVLRVAIARVDNGQGLHDSHERPSLNEVYPIETDKNSHVNDPGSLDISEDENDGQSAEVDVAEQQTQVSDTTMRSEALSQMNSESDSSTGDDNAPITSKYFLTKTAMTTKRKVDRIWADLPRPRPKRYKYDTERGSDTYINDQMDVDTIETVEESESNESSKDTSDEEDASEYEMSVDVSSAYEDAEEQCNVQATTDDGDLAAHDNQDTTSELSELSDRSDAPKLEPQQLERLITGNPQTRRKKAQQSKDSLLHAGSSDSDETATTHFRPSKSTPCAPCEYLGLECNYTWKPKSRTRKKRKSCDSCNKGSNCVPGKLDENTPCKLCQNAGRKCIRRLDDDGTQICVPCRVEKTRLQCTTQKTKKQHIPAPPEVGRSVRCNSCTRGSYRCTRAEDADKCDTCHRHGYTCDVDPAGLPKMLDVPACGNCICNQRKCRYDDSGDVKCIPCRAKHRKCAPSTEEDFKIRGKHVESTKAYNKQRKIKRQAETKSGRLASQFCVPKEKKCIYCRQTRKLCNGKLPCHQCKKRKMKPRNKPCTYRNLEDDEKCVYCRRKGLRCDERRPCLYCIRDREDRNCIQETQDGFKRTIYLTDNDKHREDLEGVCTACHESGRECFLEPCIACISRKDRTNARQSCIFPRGNYVEYYHLDPYTLNDYHQPQLDVSCPRPWDQDSIQIRPKSIAAKERRETWERKRSQRNVVESEDEPESRDISSEYSQNSLTNTNTVSTRHVRGEKTDGNAPGSLDHSTTVAVPVSLTLPIRSALQKSSSSVPIDYAKLPEPYTFRQAVMAPDSYEWKSAMELEYDSLIRNDTWKVVSRPIDRKVLTSRWVFKRKLGPDGSIRKYKGRLVACGCHQIHGEDFTETFASVVRSGSYRVLFALAATFGWTIHQMDVVTAFLNGILKETVYLEPPQGFSEDDGKVLLLQKAIYGLKQSPREWYSALVEHLENCEWTMSEFDPCVFIYKGSRTAMFMTIYVDDFNIFGPDKKQILGFKSDMARRFKMTDEGTVSFYLGMQITLNDDGNVHMHLQESIQQALSQYGLEFFHHETRFGTYGSWSTTRKGKIAYIKSRISTTIPIKSREADILCFQRASRYFVRSIDGLSL